MNAYKVTAWLGVLSVFGWPVAIETVRIHLPAGCAGLVYCRKTLDALTALTSHNNRVRPHLLQNIIFVQ